MKLRLFLVDDEMPARVRLKTLLADIANDCPHEIAGDAGNPQQALDAIAAARPDVVLLDVQMPGMTGIELAGHLCKLESAPAVIFVTAHDEYALKAFEVHALDYLLKPVRAARLAESLRRAAAMGVAHDGQKNGVLGAGRALQLARRHISVQERGRLLLVPVTDVLYCKAELKYVTLRTREHDYLVEESLTSIEEEFGAAFVRVHRNALVARDAIAGVERSMPAEPDAEGERCHESWQVIVRGIGERLPISRRQWAVVKALVR